jgi:glycosyltransferase involved in cell wall biosynthesis
MSQIELCPGHFQAGHLGECFRCQRSEVSSALKSLQRLFLTMARNFLCRGVENIAITDHVRKRHSLPNSRVIYYGIEDIPNDKKEIGEALSSPSKLCFAYVGRLVSEKGIPILLDAAARLQKQGHEFDVLLIGDGPARKKLEMEIERQGLSSRVRITGFLRGPELSILLQRVDVVVMPSVWEETAGLSAIEQMMRGRLVIASAIGGLGEVVGNVGIVCQPGDSKALAACMANVIAHPELIAELGRKARERALGTFGYARMVDEHVQLYRRAASRRQV